MFPPGQKPRSDFPRFGLTRYASRFPANLHDRIIKVTVNNSVFEINLAEENLPRSSIKADFHCVTTWSYPDAHWGGVRFRDFFEQCVEGMHTQGSPIAGAVVHAQDGYRTSMMLEDLLDDSVMLADTLDDLPLPIEHGAPLRLVAPEHYGYKNIKHLAKIEFHESMPVLKRGIDAFLDHPRARVKHEERGRWVPGWILRYLYRPLVTATVKEFNSAMDLYNSGGK